MFWTSGKLPKSGSSLNIKDVPWNYRKLFELFSEVFWTSGMFSELVGVSSIAWQFSEHQGNFLNFVEVRWNFRSTLRICLELIRSSINFEKVPWVFGKYLQLRRYFLNLKAVPWIWRQYLYLLKCFLNFTEFIWLSWNFSELLGIVMNFKKIPEKRKFLKLQLQLQLQLQKFDGFWRISSWISQKLSKLLRSSLSFS